jgi:hypothetical protein
MLSRREFISGLAGSLAIIAWNRRLTAESLIRQVDPTPITVYKSRTCGCCAKWVDHIRANGFVPEVHDEEAMDRIKDSLGVPKSARSCHTAKVRGYLIEGHVPASDIQRLLAERPKVAGLAVPDMPSQTPGMAGPGEPIEGFEVIAFQVSGDSQVFSRY